MLVPMTSEKDAAGAASAARMTAWTTSGDGIDNLRAHDLPVPTPGPHELLVQVTAQALNYRDLLVVNGVDSWRPHGPVVPLSDGVGVVRAVGDEVSRFAPGDRVSAMFLPRWRSGPLNRDIYVSPVGGPVNRGMLAEYVLVDEHEAARTPQSVTDAQAATLPVAGVTAWHAVARRSGVRAGDTVLVHGTGGVALFALQFAAALGARVAITSSSEAKLARVKRLGAELAVNYRTTDVATEILAWTHDEGVDHVIETIGGDNLNLSLRAVRIGGSISFIGLIAGFSAAVNTYEFVTKNLSIHGIETGSHEMYQEMAAFIDEHGIRPIVDSVQPVGQVQAALAHLEQGGHFGKIVLTA